MSDQLLVNVVSVTLGPGASTTVAHGLKSNGQPIAPTQVICDRNSPIQVASYSATSVVFSNTDLALAATANFRIEHDHTIHAYGATPLVWQGNGGGGGGGGGGGLSIYGTWCDLTDQIIPAGSALAVKYDTLEFTNGVTLGNNGLGQPTRLTVPIDGIYAFDISPQLAHSGGGTETITFWAAINGTPIPRSASSLEMGNNNNRTLPFLRLVTPMNAGQYLEWFFTSTVGTNITLEHFPAAGLAPEIPSVIVNVQRISNKP